MGLDGYAGLRRDQAYVLRFERLDDGQVSIELNHAQGGVGPLVVSGEQFKAWWVK